MPELPEVQTTVNGLRKNLVGLKIKDVWSNWTKTLKGLSFPSFKKEISGKKILSAERRGKNILLNLSDEKTILIHMKMTGHLIYGKWELKAGAWKAKENTPLTDPLNRFIHFIFFLSDGNQLAFSDMRKFAKIVLLDTPKVFESPDLAKLGPDPLDKKFDWKKLKERLLKRPNGKIKQILMDQTILAGIGNIYSDEILWETRIHPLTKIKNISDEKMKQILSAMKKILTNSIRLGGDSMSDYRNIEGKKGRYQLEHKIYGRFGEQCKRKGCKSLVKKIKIGGRTAHYCETCQ